MDRTKIDFSVLNTQEKLKALHSARAALTRDEQELIDEMADQLVCAVKGRNPRMQLSQNGALEVLAKIGMWHNEHIPK